MRATSIGHAGILIETEFGSITCDPWFDPAFFASWFVFPRNDQLSADLLSRIENADYLYISHLHGDHLDDSWLATHMSRDTTVLIPGFPTRELERHMRALGFNNIIRTVDREELNLGGMTVAIHVETSITDGPGGDSSLMVSDGQTRLFNQNDCRTTDLDALRQHGPVDLHWLQYSGAIWYPMVYEETPERMRELIDAKVDSQFTRSLKYVDEINAKAVVPSAGPPCFLDPELFQFNMITGDELSIFPDQMSFLSKLTAAGRNGLLAIPGTAIEITPQGCTVQHPIAEADVQAIFTDKLGYLTQYQSDWAPWLKQAKASWHPPTTNLLQTLKAWWEPLLAMAPTLRSAVGANCLMRIGDLEIIIDFPAGQIREFNDEPYRFRFEIQRELVETVVADRAVDWSNALFLSCRFRAWRHGAFNEYLYNFFKSLSVERMRRAEAEARRKLDPPDGSEEIELGGYIVERVCPHRQADLSVFGEVEGQTLVCTLHGWRFDLESGECLTASDRRLRVRRADPTAGS
ncbi:MAG: Rieske 2Fe-2S domain-containing protein [Actinobacteria bacterium]|nr:Rieske 2Fe-2S domain-containing protein [Actinomycetota bacterium]